MSVGQTVRMPVADDASGDLAGHRLRRRARGRAELAVLPVVRARAGRASTPRTPASSCRSRRWSSPGLTDPQRARLAARLGSRLVDGVLTIAASEHRQQLRNRQAARERLAAVLRPPSPHRRRAAAGRSRPAGSQERRIEAKKQRGQLKKQRRTWD